MVMAQQKTEKDESKSKERQGSLPVPIHPDDAKDKVFAAILKALIKMENKPSSPKELANIIVKHKYATLGGATPFATVSSRISQHFKRAAEHNPPRAPLLAKHVDQNHSRKINYSLATESVPTSETQEEEINSHEKPTHNRKPSRSRNEPVEQYGSKRRKVDSFDVSHSDSENEHSDFHEEMFKGTEDELDIKRPYKNSTSNTLASHSEPSKLSLAPQEGVRKPSFSFSSGFPGEQELWTPFSFEHDFENVFIHDPSTAHHIPFNIATPESVSVSELDDYFGSSSSPRSHRRSFSSAMLGPNDKTLLQKVLLASAARGIADKIEEKTEEEIEKEKADDKQTTENPQTTSQPITVNSKSVSSSSLMNVENSEDFVKFEDDEKKEPTAPTPILPANTKRDTASSAAALSSASELLKSMNIQNVNLPALQQMTSSLQALQQLSPTFDLAKTMTVYMQSLKSAASTPSSSSAQPAIDMKSIFSRFPVLEALLKKDNTSKNLAPAPVSSSADAVPNLVNVNSSDPVVHTLSPTTPAMYITVVDHIAVCIVVLDKTETTPEYRIMRRLDTGFINGTALLAAGGIETESERSMILSFEMDRVRMPKKKSPLFGTWISLRRAQELAITCSVQHKLGHFLEDSIEAYFPSLLPIQMAARKPTNGRLTTLALAALRSEKSVSRVQLQDMFSSKKNVQDDARKSDSKQEDSGDSVSSDESDTDVKTNLLAGSALQELLARASLPHPTHIHPKDLQKKKRRSSLPELPEDSQEEDKVQKNTRKRSGGGKWPQQSGGGKLASYGIKKSASAGGSIFAKRAPVGGKRTQQKKTKEEDELRNMVVKHTSNSQPVHPTSIPDLDDKSEENEEDEDIDIGGSDFDDDLR